MKNYSPLSKVQYGIYAECVGHAGEICYNLPYLYILDKSLDEERLRRAVVVGAKHPVAIIDKTCILEIVAQLDQDHCPHHDQPVSV